MGKASCHQWRGLIALLVVAVLVPLAMWRPVLAAAPVASFDWSMPDRFGLDRNHGGVVDYVDGATGAMTGYDATPESWRVDVHACASADSAHATFHRTVVDQPDPAAPDRRERRPGCDGAARWTSPGRGPCGPVVEVDSVSSAPLRRDLVDWDSHPAPAASGAVRWRSDRCRATIRGHPPTFRHGDLAFSGRGTPDRQGGSARRDVPLAVEPTEPAGLWYRARRAAANDLRRPPATGCPMRAGCLLGGGDVGAVHTASGSRIGPNSMHPAFEVHLAITNSPRTANNGPPGGADVLGEPSVGKGRHRQERRFQNASARRRCMS